jgi:hypothetical protein
MNLRLFQEPMELNLAFEQVIQGLQRMEKVQLFHSDIIRYARADVESARVDSNREFFDNFRRDRRTRRSIGLQIPARVQPGDPRTRTRSISKSRTPRKGARKRDCLRAW